MLNIFLRRVHLPTNKPKYLISLEIGADVFKNTKVRRNLYMSVIAKGGPTLEMFCGDQITGYLIRHFWQEPPKQRGTIAWYVNVNISLSIANVLSK